MRWQSHLHGPSNSRKGPIHHQMRYLVPGRHLLLNDIWVPSLESQRLELTAQGHQDHLYFTHPQKEQPPPQKHLISQEDPRLQLRGENWLDRPLLDVRTETRLENSRASHA